MAPQSDSQPLVWWREPRWLALWAAFLGYLMDAMDVLLYVFAVQAIRAEFQFSNAQAGLVTSFTLIASAAGGIAAGMLSDRLGRRRVLIYTILLYSMASAGSATSSSLTQLLFWRSLVGLGLGGEWSAGSVLVAESWPAEHRAKAIGFMQSGWALGYMAAAGVTALVLPRFGWRALFLVGVLPALLTVGIRRAVREPEVWLRQRKPAPMLDLFRPPLAQKTWIASALATSVLLGYWGLFTWLPSFLSSPKAAGGAGLGIVGGSAWMFAVQGGALAGYLAFGWLADRFGRRPAFLFYVLGAALVVPIYGYAPSWAAESSGTILLLLGPLIGFFGSGYFSLFGAMLAELFPTSLRGAGQGLCYNLGRALGAAAPYTVGSLADSHGLGAALGLNSCFFLLAAALIFALPETRRARLEEPAGGMRY
jgi:MFS family permease